MTPVYNEILTDDIDDDTLDTDSDSIQPGLTWFLDPDTETISSSMIDDLDAVKQAVWVMLQTMRGEHEIYSDDFGTEIYNLIGDPIPLAYAEIEDDIRDTLLEDDRISDVTDFELYKDRISLLVTFRVVTNINGGEEFESGVRMNGESD